MANPFDKINSLSKGKKVAFIICMLMILLALFLFAMGKRIDTITYPDNCKEIYENGKLTTPECTESRKLAGTREGLAVYTKIPPLSPPPVVPPKLE